MNHKLIGLTLIGWSLICFTFGVIGNFDEFINPYALSEPDNYTVTLHLSFFAYSESTYWYENPRDNITIEFYQVIDGILNYRQYNSSNETTFFFSVTYRSEALFFFRFMKTGYWPEFVWMGFDQDEPFAKDGVFEYNYEIIFYQKPTSINMITFTPYTGINLNASNYYEQLYFEFGVDSERFIKTWELYTFSMPMMVDDEWEEWDQFVPVIQLEFNQTVYQQAFKYSDNLSPFAMMKNVAYFKIRDGSYLDCQELRSIKIQNTSFGFINASFGYLYTENDLFYSGNQFLQEYPLNALLTQINSLLYVNSTLQNVSFCVQNPTGQWNCTEYKCVNDTCTAITPGKVMT